MKIWIRARDVGRILCVALLTSCASHVPAPIEQKAVAQQHGKNPASSRNPGVPHGESTYRVVAGDTLYSIAWRFDLDPRKLAQWNDISDPNRIFIGQTLRLKQTATATAVPTRGENVAIAKSADDAYPQRSSPALASRNEAAIAPALPAAGARLHWGWPAEGKAVRAVSASGSIGLEIKGQRGQPIKAAAGGEVVYGGSGLRGYGQLLIIKHDDSFLSAYAHNDKLLVSEGQRVEPGQPIALMGDSEATEVMLHFEIRKGGMAVEPLQYLPQR